MADVSQPEQPASFEWLSELPDGPQAAQMFNDDRLRGALASAMGIEFTYVSPERVAASMPVEGNTQPYGLLHGGASAVLAETVGSVAAALNAGPSRMAVGIELNATHHRSARTGHVHAVATPLSTGRTLSSFQIAITDDEGRVLCTSRLTCLSRDIAP